MCVPQVVRPTEFGLLSAITPENRKVMQECLYVIRGLKTMDTSILTGYPIYHNCVRSHEAVEGQTPVDACGISARVRRQQVDNTNQECQSKMKASSCNANAGFYQGSQFGVICSSVHDLRIIENNLA